MTAYDIPTLLLDTQNIFDGAMFNVLKRAVFVPRRPRGGQLPLLFLFQQMTEGYCFRWDETFLRPASKIAEIAQQKITAALSTTKPVSIRLARVGDCLLIDNWRMLHARSPIPSGKEDRKIQRVYLENLH